MEFAVDVDRSPRRHSKSKRGGLTWRSAARFRARLLSVRHCRVRCIFTTGSVANAPTDGSLSNVAVETVASAEAAGARAAARLIGPPFARSSEVGDPLAEDRADAVAAAGSVSVAKTCASSEIREMGPQNTEPSSRRKSNGKHNAG